MPSSTRAIRSVGADVLGAGLQRHVGHPLDRHVVRRVGVRAAVGPGLPEPRREHPVQLIADEDAVAHQIPALRAHPFVVETDGGQAEFDGPVGGHVHHRRAVAHRAELVRGGERGARIGGLVADRPVVFGGVADGFVDGQPQVGRVDHQVGRARPSRWAPWSSRPAATAAAASSSVQSHTSSPASASQPRRRRRRQGAHRLEAARRGVDGDGLQRRHAPAPAAG